MARRMTDKEQARERTIAHIRNLGMNHFSEEYARSIAEEAFEARLKSRFLVAALLYRRAASCDSDSKRIRGWKRLETHCQKMHILSQENLKRRSF